MEPASQVGMAVVTALLLTLAPSNAYAGQVNFASVLGGDGQNLITTTSLDSQKNVIVGGQTYSKNLPVSPNAFRQSYQMLSTKASAFIAKLSADGQRIIWLTYFPAYVSSAIADKNDNVIVTGFTTPDLNLPVSANAFQRTGSGGADVFIAKLSSDGSTLMFSTLLGGNGDEGPSTSARPTALSPDGSILLCGETNSSNFPLAKPPTGSPDPGYPGRHQVFAARISSDGSQLLQVAAFPALTCRAIVPSSDGAAIIAGVSVPAYDVTTAGGFNPKLTGPRGDADVFVMKVFSNRSSTTPPPDFVSVFGGSHGDSPDDITIDPASGSIFVTGSTWSSDFPVAQSAYRQLFSQSTGANTDTFVAKLSNSDGSVVAATFLDLFSPPYLGLLGGTGAEVSFNAIALLPTGDVVIAGPYPYYSLGSSPFWDSVGAITISGDLKQKRSFVWFSGGNGRVQFLGGAYLISTGLRPSSGDGVPVYYLGPGALPSTANPLDFGTVIGAIDLTNPSPTLSSQSITSSATNSVTALAPGLLLSIYGQSIGPDTGVQAVSSGSNLPTALASVSVHGGYPSPYISMPILFAGPNQTNISLSPFQSFGSQSRDKVLYLTYRGLNSEVIPFNTAAYSPGVFTTGGVGTGQAAALNADGSINGTAQAAARGSVVSLFVTGLGTYVSSVSKPDDPSDISSSALSTSRIPVVTIGGITSQVLYSGAAPGLVSSAYQINAKVPDNAPVGPTVPLVLQMTGASSQQGVFLAVK